MTTPPITISSGVTSSGVTVSGGSTYIVASGGTASSFTVVANTFASNGMSNQAGGTVVSATVSSGGNLYEIGGVDRFTTILAGGFELVSSGGVASNTVMSGGTFRVAQGGTIVSASVLANAILSARVNGVVSNSTISNGGEIIVASGGSASGSVVLSGGFEIVTSSANGFGADVKSGGTEVVSSGGTATSTTIENGGTLALRGLAFSAGGSASFDSSTNLLTVVEGANTYTETLAGSYTGLYFHTSSSSANASTNVFVDTNPACFCAGTRLLTEDGAIAVEDLVEGMALLTVRGAASRRVRWIGQRDTALARHPRPWDVQPVRVLADAFAPGMPAQDVRLSPDHAVFSDGHLIPVRALINGASIVQESIDRVTYYHVELEDADGQAVHDVLLAQGLPVESYLDTGNRSAFANGGGAVMAHPDFALQVWDALACAPLAVEGPVVRDIRHRLLARAVAMGFALTGDADLCLIADGRVLRPSEVSGETLRFTLPHPAARLALVSRLCVPAETDPDSDDRRSLGVAVRSVSIDGVPVGLADLARGWHPAEPEWRWTAGEAALPGPAQSEVVVRLWAGGRYWVPAEASTGERAVS